MNDRDRAMIQAETDVLVGSCRREDVGARAAMYEEQDRLYVEYGRRDPRAAEWPGVMKQIMRGAP